MSSMWYKQTAKPWNTALRGQTGTVRPGRPGSVGRAEGDRARSQQEPKNKTPRAEVERGTQKMQPGTKSGTETEPRQSWELKAEARQRSWARSPEPRPVREGRPARPPDRAEKCVHLQALPRLGPQQEHILWETEGHCHGPPLAGSGPSPLPHPGLPWPCPYPAGQSGSRHHRDRAPSRPAWP